MSKYEWRQCYEMGDGSLHWALCDQESDKEGRVTCCYTVLLACYDTCCDGRPVSEQSFPKRIVELLNKYGGPSPEDGERE